MYTELFLDCHINAKLLSDNEKAIITYLFDYDNNDIDTPTIFPKHYFFRCSRWYMIGRGGSAYFDDDVPKSLTKNGDDWHIISRSDFKNYDSEIELFLYWFKPFIVNSDSNGVIGHYHYEEDCEPTLIYI